MNKLHMQIKNITEVTDRENANVGNSPSAKLLQIAESANREYALEQLPESKRVIKSMLDNKIYPHDYSWMPVGTTTCVPDFEYTLLKDDKGNTFRVQFDYFNKIIENNKDLVIENNGQEILDLTQTETRFQIWGRTGWTPLNKIMRRKMNDSENMYKFLIHKDFPLHLTENHQVPVIRDNNEILITANEIVVGDKLLKAKTIHIENDELDILNLFLNSDVDKSEIQINNARKLIQWIRYYYTDFNFYKEVSDRSNKEGINKLTLEEFEIINNKYAIPYEVKAMLSISCKGSKKILPTFMPITEELGRLLGYIMSESSISNTNDLGTYQISIHNQNEDILEDIKYCIQSVFNENPSLRKDSRSQKKVAYALCGKLYLIFIRDVLGVKESVEKIHIPSFIYNSNDLVKNALLSGLFDGDGNYSNKHIVYSTVSETLAKELIILFETLNIKANYRFEEIKGTDATFGNKIDKRKYNNHLVTITDVANLTKFIDTVNTLKGNDKTRDYVCSTEGRYLDNSSIVKDIMNIEYNRYVFDLETGEHWFTVNDYVVHNCLFIPFGKLLKNGFNTGHGFIRPPKRISKASNLYCIIFQSNQNSQHGGQASGWFEQDLAPYVLLEYDFQYKQIVEDYEEQGIEDYDVDKAEKLAWKRTDRETYQAMEALVHNLNSMHSRAGAQVPFTSVNIGTGTSKAERMIIKNLLLAYERGLGKGEQALFPNIVFKVKSGVNYEVGTPNHDLLRLSLRVSAKRLFPTYNFQDCTLNKDFPEDVPSMGCRTRVGWNRHSNNQTCLGRGNLSFTTVNTVGIALDTKLNQANYSAKSYKELKEKYDINIENETDLVKKYFVNLNEEVDTAIEQLLKRYESQCKFKVADFPFLMEGNWMDSELLKPTDTLETVLKHGTLTVGFIGIAETLMCLLGQHHGENKNALKLGIEIVKFMRAKMNEACELHDMNFSLIATPAEGLSGKFLGIDKKLYGEIEGVTDKEWYTNSYHIPVDYEISAIRKIEIEGQFTKYCNGGTINYVELKESPLYNIDAMYSLIQAMYNSDISIGAINFPCDRCIDCGHHGTIEGNICSVCGSTNISRIARITGYLAEINNFNHAKYMERLNRVKHSF